MSSPLKSIAAPSIIRARFHFATQFGTTADSRLQASCCGPVLKHRETYIEASPQFRKRRFGLRLLRLLHELHESVISATGFAEVMMGFS